MLQFDTDVIPGHRSIFPFARVLRTTYEFGHLVSNQPALADKLVDANEPSEATSMDRNRWMLVRPRRVEVKFFSISKITNCCILSMVPKRDVAQGLMLTRQVHG